MTVKTLSVR